MTKRVRIENADCSDFKVLVQVWDRGYPEGQPDRLTQEIELSYPCEVTPPELYITSTRYLIVKELKP